jgi:hypothetical protein
MWNVRLRFFRSRNRVRRWRDVRSCRRLGPRRRNNYRGRQFNGRNFSSRRRGWRFVNSRRHFVNNDGRSHLFGGGFVDCGLLCRDLPLQVSNFVAQGSGYLCGSLFGSFHALLQLVVTQVERNH